MPHAFADNEWLGDFIGKIRNATGINPLVAAQVIRELRFVKSPAEVAALRSNAQMTAVAPSSHAAR